MADDRDFTIAGVLRGMAAFFGRQRSAILLLALTLLVVPHFLIALGVSTLSAPYLQWKIWTPPLVDTVSLVLLIGSMSWIATLEQERSGAAFRSGLAAALRSYLPNLGVTLLCDLAMIVGAILLVFPAFLILCRWFVVNPAQAIERTGVFGAMARSRDLTEGHRWRLFGLMLLDIPVVFGVDVLAYVGGRGIGTLGLSIWPVRILYALLTTASLTIASLVAATALPVVFLQLRRVKEGGSPAQVAAIFE